jgi:1-acyl-sn-glycerol-3-phosphate acyltransferase
MIRGALKLTAFIAWTAFFYVLLALWVPVLRVLRFRETRWFATFFRAWGRGAARILGMRIEVKGQAPEAPFLLVSNHLSYVDVAVLASQVGGVFVARGDAARWPVAGAMCRASDTIFVDRERRADVAQALRQMETALGRGQGVVLFPEGTSSAGATVLPFRPSLLAAAARNRLPVSFASLTYVGPAGGPSARETVCWWGDMTLGDHLVQLFRLRGFTARVRFGRETLQESDRKVLAARLHAAVVAGFEPVRDEMSPDGISDRLTAGQESIRHGTAD